MTQRSWSPLVPPQLRSRSLGPGIGERLFARVDVTKDDNTKAITLLAKTSGRQRKRHRCLACRKPIKGEKRTEWSRRAIPLPHEVGPDQSAAHVKNCLLKIRPPKSRAAIARQEDHKASPWASAAKLSVLRLTQHAARSVPWRSCHRSSRFPTASYFAFSTAEIPHQPPSHRSAWSQ